MKGQEDNQKCSEARFISGVVEGFYGRPWSGDQRRLMFFWMQKSGLNTYMYAPKDDYKHRAYWRDLYSVEEAENLTLLISAAKEKGVTFVYAISPGLDISFSNSKDVQALKRKLEQVSSFGCDAFAVLFDDIDPELSEADRSAFQSFGAAQVSVSNEVYQHLNQPKLFLFCPTEYCASRAVPTVASSEYLNTIGSKLLPGIDIMWTGPRVVSKKLTIPSLEEIGSVLKRPAVIWDNIHANDYDPRRIFLGPYDGRSPEIIPYINGVMTNPNTEFEANYVAIHTLGQWCKSNPGGVKKDIINNDRLSPIASDIKLETESDFSSDEDLSSHIDIRYQPKKALKLAMADWLTEIHCPREPPRQPFPRVIPTFLPPGVNTDAPSVPSGPPGVPPCPPPGPPIMLPPSPPPSSPPGVPTNPPGNPSIPPGIVPFQPDDPPTPQEIPFAAQPCVDPADLVAPDVQPVAYMPPSPPAGLPLPDVIKTCLTPAFTTATITSAGITPLPLISTSAQAPEPIPTFLQPPSLPVNSLLEPPPSDTDSISDTTSAAESGGMEPMEVATPCSSEHSEGAHQGLNSVSMPSVNSTEHDTTPKLEKQTSSDSLMQVEASEMMDRQEELQVDSDLLFTEEDALLLADLFYMPFEHGGQGIFLLQRLLWLRENVQNVSNHSHSHSNSFEGTEWYHLAQEFMEKVDSVVVLLKKLVAGPNKSFMCDLYSYVWDLVSILKISKAFVQWLAKGVATHPMAQQTYGCVTWFSKGYKEAFMSGDQEPWIFRGGLQVELQRLLPIDSAHDLFYIKPPDYIVNKTFSLRPFKTEDEEAVYNICLKTCDDGLDGTQTFSKYPQLMGDKLIGRLVTLSPEFGFVMEDEMGVCGYVLCALDSRDLQRKSEMAWIPEMREKYPINNKGEGRSRVDEAIQSFHAEQPCVPEEVYNMYPSVLRIDMLPARVEDPSIPRRLLACALSALKCCGSKGAHCEVVSTDKFMIDFYAKLGFFHLSPAMDPLDKPGENLVYLGRPV